MSNNNTQVFISYGRDEIGNKRANELYERIDGIDKYELRPFLDARDLKDGKYWNEGLRRQIRASFLMIVLCSAKANLSQYVRDEWNFAMGAEIPIIAIEIQQDTKAPIPPELMAYHSSNLNFLNPKEKDWQKLTNTVVKIFESIYIPSHVARAMEFAEHPLADYRMQALESLRDSEHPQAIEALAQLCEDSFLPDIRWLAALFLAQRHKDKRAIPVLSQKALKPAKHLSNIHSTVIASIDALFGINSQEAFDASVGIYQNGDREHKLNILNKFHGRDNTEAIPAMKKCLKYKESNPPESKKVLLTNGAS